MHTNGTIEENNVKILDVLFFPNRGMGVAIRWVEVLVVVVILRR